MDVVFVSRVFRDSHHRMPWRFEVAGAAEYSHHGRAEEKVEEFRDRQVLWLAGQGYEVVEIDAREMATT